MKYSAIVTMHVLMTVDASTAKAADAKLARTWTWLEKRLNPAANLTAQTSVLGGCLERAKAIEHNAAFHFVSHQSDYSTDPSLDAWEEKNTQLRLATAPVDVLP